MPAKLDFAAIAESVDVETVAQFLKLKQIRDRFNCPACESERAIELFPETNTFACYAGTPRPGRDYLGGDVIGFVAHVRGYDGMYKAAKELAEQFGTANAAPAAPATAPQKPEARTAQAQPAPASRKADDFDPAAFAEKLRYTEEVAVLGITEADAAMLGIGYQRGRVYFPQRHLDGSIAGYIGYADGALKIPPKWLPSKVVPFKRTA